MDLEVLKSTEGLIKASQIVLAFCGCIFALVPGQGHAFWTFVLVTTIIISGILLGLEVFPTCTYNLNALEAKFPWLIKAQLGYVAIWTILYGICVIISWVSFGLSAIIVYLLLALFLLDLFFRYRAYKASEDESNPNATADAEFEENPFGDNLPKY